MLLVEKCNFYFYLFSVKKNIQIRFKDVLDLKKQTFFDFFIVSKTAFFQSCFWSKMPLFSLFVFGQNKTRNSTYWLCGWKRNLFWLLKLNVSKSLKSHFSKGVTLAFGQKMEFCLLFSLKIRPEVRVNNVLDRKQKFFWL